MAHRSNTGDEERKFTVYIRGLQDGILQSHIEQIFKNCDIVSVRIPRDRETNAFMGYAFAEFQNERSMCTALQLSGVEVNGQPIDITVATRNRRDNRGSSRSGSFQNGHRGGGYNNGPRFNNNRGDWYGGNRAVLNNGYNTAPSNGNRGGYRNGSRGGRNSFQPNSYNNRSGMGNNNLSRSRIPSHQNIEPIQSNPDDPNRPRLNIKPRSVPVASDRNLSERSQAIFGTGRPREASPIREKLDKLSINGSESSNQE